MIEVLLTSGTGPVEVRRFVAALAEVMGAALPVAARAVTGPDDAPSSVVLWVDAERVDDWVGVHALQRRGDRRRWMVGVWALPPVPTPAALDPGDVVVRACRAGGPGGQSVNTTSSAIVAEHLPTGLRVRMEDERSQHANRRRAMARLAEVVARAGAAEGAAIARQRWLAHREARGAPVRCWRDRGRGLEPVGGAG